MTSTPNTVAEDVTTTLLTFPDLVPPADPSSLIGSTMSSKPTETTPELLINGSTTNLTDSAGACVDDGCARGVSLLADRESPPKDGWWPTSVYLVLESFLDRDAAGGAIWTVVDAMVIDVPTGQSLELLVEGCVLTGLSADVSPVAILVDWARSPRPTPTRVWALDQGNDTLVELPVDPAWVCEPVGD